jgi:F-type H+-transporting ATPase subunit b
MASRLARTAVGEFSHQHAIQLRAQLGFANRKSLTTAVNLGAARLRPSLAQRTLPSLTSLTAVRASSNVPAEDPKSKAQSIIDSLPGNGLISKSAILSSAAGLSIYAISNEYYVVNEETVVAFCLLSVWGALIKFGGPMYKEWAEAQNEKIKNILNAARADHTEAVKARKENVQQMSEVVDITKTLFAVSKVSAGECSHKQRG